MADNYNVNDMVKLSGLKSLAQRTKTELTALDTKLSATFRSLSVSGNTVSFFNSTDASGTALATLDFPEEIFLDQAGTTLVETIAFRQIPISTAKLYSCSQSKATRKPIPPSNTASSTLKS